MNYLYVCHFSNGHIKVGRSINPMARIASHEDRVSCLGVELVEHRIFECVGHVVPAEAELIRRCGEVASKTNKNEWFEGLDFLEACDLAHEVASMHFEVAAGHKGFWPDAIARLKLAGMTQTQMASECKTTQSTINKLANGRTEEPMYSLGVALLALLENQPEAA